MATGSSINTLLIGGCGYFGSRLAQDLQKRGHQVWVTSRSVSSSVSYADHLVQLETIPWNVSFQSVIYLAGPTQQQAAENPQAALQSSNDFLGRVLERMRIAAPQTPFLYVSTFHVYGTNAVGRITEQTSPAPGHPYGQTKLAGEDLVRLFQQKYQLQTLVIRLSNAFGDSPEIQKGGTLLFNDLCHQAVHQQKLRLNSTGQQYRNFITLEDACRAIEFLTQHVSRWPADRVIHLGSSLQYRIIEVADHVARCSQTLFGTTPPIQINPKAIPQPVIEFVFDVSRLADLGFQWTSQVDHEIEQMLKHYAQR